MFMHGMRALMRVCVDAVLRVHVHTVLQALTTVLIGTRAVVVVRSHSMCLLLPEQLGRWLQLHP